MLTLLSKIFSQDIAEHIYKFIISDYENEYLSSIHLMELLIEKTMKKDIVLDNNKFCVIDTNGCMTTYKNIESFILRLNKNKNNILKNMLKNDMILVNLIKQYLNILENLDKNYDINNFNNAIYYKIISNHILNIKKII
tara:strand:- start:483 stop:899 length:417 start_codon:yes stop_codon:yes gene_type:complete